MKVMKVIIVTMNHLMNNSEIYDFYNCLDIS